MFSLRRSFVVAGYFAGVIATTSAHAGAKDESAAEWLAPKWFNDWHDRLAAKGLNFTPTYIGHYIRNVSGRTGPAPPHPTRLQFSAHADPPNLLRPTRARVL